MEEKPRETLNLKTRDFILVNHETEERKTITVEEDDVLAIFRGLRPRNMSYDDFKAIQALLKKELAQYLKGQVVHLSKVSDSVWDRYVEGKKIKQRGNTYKKSEQ
jgi:hypothetical protein